jgi:hypothetical protein
MNRLIFIILLVLLFVIASTALAQSSNSYDLTWSTMDGGGGESIGSGYTLAGTVGQLDAGATMTGGGFTLAGGFWIGGASQYHVYLPLAIK